MTTMAATIVLILTVTLLFPMSVTSLSIHDLLRSRGLPGGLFPRNGVKSYELSEDGLLKVYLERPCLAKFEGRVFFNSVVMGNLTYGSLTGVEGLEEEELFLWLPVKDIIVGNPNSGIILFNIGVARKQMSISLFEVPPVCISKHRPDGMLKMRLTSKESEESRMQKM